MIRETENWFEAGKVVSGLGWNLEKLVSIRTAFAEEVEGGSDRRRRREGRKVRRHCVLLASGRLGIRNRVPWEW